MITLINRFYLQFIFLILFFITLFCWTYTFLGIGMEMSAWEMTINQYKKNSSINNIDTVFFKRILTNSYLITSFLMWFLMMIAMMLPSAIPVIVMFDKISNERKKFNYRYVPTLYFVISYILVWLLFSLFATIVHILLELYGILNSSSLKVGYQIGGILFILAGIYQVTPLKYACLYYCKNPIELLGGKNFFKNFDAFFFGIKHGFFCVGCCWMLMLLLFYVGIMNIFWIVGLTLYIMFEKYFIKQKKFNLATGFILVFWGCKILFL